MLFTFPSRYLFTIGRPGYLALGGGPPGFPRGSTCPVVLGILSCVSDFSPTRLLLSVAGLSRPLRLSPQLLIRESRNPSTPKSTGLGSPLFARRYWGVRFFFLFLRLLRCFSSPGAPRIPMGSVCGDGGSPPPGCPIRRSTDLRLLAATRSFSQLTTSFVGPEHLGIRRMLFLA